MIILDASAAYEFLLRTTAGTSVAARLHGVPMLHAPHLLDVEVASSLRRAVAKGWITPDRAMVGLEDLRTMHIVRYWHTPLLDRMWELRENFTAYDACYLALAERLNATLLTRDRALASAQLFQGTVELI